MGIGGFVVGVPLTFPITKRWGALAWGALLALLLRRRIDYASALTVEGTPPPRGFTLRLPVLVALDQISSVMALRDLASRDRRFRW
jgi:hypothetical protein